MNDWLDEIECAKEDPKIFFPEDAPDRSEYLNLVREAKNVCSRCPVIAECADYACRQNVEWGIFGGMTFRERQRWARQRKKSALTVQSMDLFAAV